MKEWNDPNLTTEEARDMGKRDALEAIKKRLEMPWGMTWEEPEQAKFQDAYEEGVKEMMKAYVIERFPKAEAVEHEEHDNFWRIEAEPLELCDYVNGTEHEAWEEAAKNIYQAMH